MKNGCLTIMLTFIVVFWILVIFTPEPEPVPDTAEIYLPSPTPDSGREVYRFDWNKMDYIYKDEIKKDSKTYKDHAPMPDFYVAPMNPSYENQREVQVTHKNKRYRVLQQPNGTLKLIPIR